MRALAHVAVVVALLAVGTEAVSGPGTRAAVWDFRTGLTLLRWAAYGGGAAAVLGVGALVRGAVGRDRRAMALAAVALVLGLASFLPPYLTLRHAQGLPPIHDISTDLADPPAFVEVLKRRTAPGLNSAVHEGAKLAEQQRRAYPDLVPLAWKVSPADAFRKAEAVVQQMGWEPVAADAAAGRIEATDTTTFFGFKDDVVVRIRASAEGSVVDVRSLSRVGRGDAGKNAQRVRAFMAALSGGA